MIEGCQPLLSPHFNLTVEIPLKTIVRGYSWTVMPITWRNRRTGVAKLKIKEMGSRYLFICLYLWLEKYFSRGDYRKKRDCRMGAPEVNRPLPPPPPRSLQGKSLFSMAYRASSTAKSSDEWT